MGGRGERILAVARPIRTSRGEAGGAGNRRTLEFSLPSQAIIARLSKTIPCEEERLPYPPKPPRATQTPSDRTEKGDMVGYYLQGQNAAYPFHGKYH